MVSGVPESSPVSGSKGCASIARRDSRAESRAVRRRPWRRCAGRACARACRAWRQVGAGRLDRAGLDVEEEVLAVRQELGPAVHEIALLERRRGRDGLRPTPRPGRWRRPPSARRGCRRPATRCRRARPRRRRGTRSTRSRRRCAGACPGRRSRATASPATRRRTRPIRLPGSARTSDDASSRMRNRDFPADDAGERERAPSGETAKKSFWMVRSGRTIDRSIRAPRPVAAAAGRRRRATAPASSSAAAITHGSQARRVRPRPRRRAPPVCEPLARSTSSSRLTSAALCQRSSGSLARQVRTTRSSAAGTPAATREIGAGSSFMIDEISDAWLAPENAFLPGRHLVEHRAEGEDVGARVGLLALELLGRHVLERPEDRAFLRQALLRRERRQAARVSRRRHRLGQAEVEQLDARLRQHHVAGLQVAVDDAAPVRLVQRVGDLGADPKRLLERQRALGQTRPTASRPRGAP